MMLKTFTLIIACLLFQAELLGQNIQGRIVSQKDKAPISYINIGIVGTTLGTISDSDGNFSLSVKDHWGDTLRISGVGYQPQTLRIEKKLADSLIIVELPEKSIVLDEVDIHAKSLSKQKRYGTRSQAKYSYTGWYGGIDPLGKGTERGIKIKIKKSKVFLTDLYFHLAANTYDSVLFRLRIYLVEDGLPGKELTKQNIFIGTRKSRGVVHRDLRAFNILLKEDFILSLEWVRVWGNINKSDKLHLSTRKFRGTLYAKRSSESNWVVRKRVSPSIYVLANSYR